MTPRTRSSIVRRILATLERGRSCYERADALFERLLAGTPLEAPIATPEGEYMIVDNFAKKNVHYRPARVHRFELKRVPKMPRNPPAPPAP
jgi:hypothetical protein